MPSHPPPKSLSVPVYALSSRTDTRMLAQQQARLLGSMSRLLLRLLKSLLWQEMGPKERKRILAWLSQLEQELRSVRPLRETTLTDTGD